jgi:hypothetical protein
MRCRLFWRSNAFGWVRCVHNVEGHPDRHEGGEMWHGRYPSFIAVGAEASGAMECFFNQHVS